MSRRRRVLVGGESRGRGGLILPGEAARQGVPELFVPKGYETGPVVLVGKCHLCDATFYRGQEQAWQEHVGECARSQLDEIRHQREQERKTSIFNEDNWDPELAAHMKKVGERMLREGRLVMKPNERAGF